MKNGLIRSAAPLPLRHVVEEQSFDVRFARQEAAHRLLGPLSDLNRTRLLPLIERVFDEFDVPGEVIRIDRLALDLGRFGEDALRHVEPRLERALRSALREALARDGAGRFAPLAAAGPAPVRRPAAEALLDHLDHWLVRGTWPYGAGIDLATSPAALLAILLDSPGGALAAKLRARRGSEAALRRLVQQIPEPLLQRLLHRLDPDSAAWILDYMAETRAAHAEAPLVEETPEAFGRTLWIVVLRDALHRAGLRANRRAFVGKLIADLAAAGGVDRAALIAELQRALAAIPRAGRGDASLLSILAEVAAAQGLDPPELQALAALLAGTGGRVGPQEPAEILSEALRRRPAEARRRLREAMAADPANLLRRLHGAGGPAALLRMALGERSAAPWVRPLSAAKGAAAIALLLGEAARAGAGRKTGLASKGGGAEGADGPDGPVIGEPWRRDGATDSAGGVRASASLGRRKASMREASPGQVPGGPHFAALDGLLAEALEAADGRLGRALAAAFAADSAGLRRWLRRRLRRDRALAARLAGDVGFDRLAGYLLPRHSAALLRGLARLAAVTASAGNEAEALLAAAARLPAGAPAPLLARHLADALAERRGVSAEALLERLASAAAASSGGEDSGLADALGEALHPESDAGPSIVARRRAVDLLRTLMLVPAAGAAIARALEVALAGLSGTPFETLLAELAVAPAERARAAAALARLSSRALLRLHLLLAPPSGEARATLRRVLREAGGQSAELAGLLAARLAGEDIEAWAGKGWTRRRGWADSSIGGRSDGGRPESRSAARTAGNRPAAGESAAGRDGAMRSPRALETAAEAALHRLAAAGATEATASKRDVALLLRHRPFDLLRLVADRAAPAARRLIAAEETMALLFAALPPGERREAEAMARLLTTPAARRALSAEALAASFARTVSAALLGRRRAGFAEIWREALGVTASPRELRGLDRLLPVPVGRSKGVAPPPPREAEPGSAAWFLALLESPSPEARRRLRALLRAPALRRRLARRLPRHLLARLLAVARPREARSLLSAMELVAAAAAGRLDGGTIWEAMLDGAAAEEGGAVARFADSILAAPAAEFLVEPLLRRVRAAAHGPLAAVLEERAAAERRERTARKPALPPEPVRLEPQSPFDPGRDEGEALAVRNAGLVLAAPYFPRLFESVGLVARDSAGRLGWVEPEAAGRGVHLLQYLVDGRTDAPEPLLPLNKILCGLDPGWPVGASIEPTEAEIATCDSLLEAILAYWPMLSGSSVAALRETFFQREGKITRIEAGWKLDVERKLLDVLLDSIPWSFSMILAPWMPEPLSVTW